MKMLRPLIVLCFASCCRMAAQTDEAPPDLKQLSLDELATMEVTSVSRYPEQLREAPSAIQVITSEDIRRSGAATLPDSLRLADNLDVAQKDPHDWAVSARGFNANVGNKLLVLMDGRTVYTPLFSGVFWNAQDYLLEDVDRVEVISGPGGTIWGANAVNGVINITTKSAKETQGTYVEAGGGTALEDFVGFRYGGKLAPNVYFRVYGKYLGYDNGALGNDGEASDSWHQGQGGFRIDAEPSLQNTLTLQGDYYSGIENLQSGAGARIAGGNVLGRMSHLFSSGSMSLQLYYDRTHLVDPFGASPFAPAGLLKDNLDTYDLDFKHDFEVGEQNHLVWGFGYRFIRDNVYHPAPNLTFLPQQQDQNLANIFMQDEIKLQDRLHLTLGSKFEHTYFTGFEWEPNGRLRWDFTPTQMLWAAVSRAVRAPSRFDHDLHEPNPPPIILTGDSNFRSEAVVAYELGYRAQFSSRFSAAVSTFYNEYRDLRSLSLTPVSVFPIHYDNNLAARTHGVELSADFRVLDWWRLRGGYDLLKEHVWVRPGKTDLLNALDETADPEQQFSIRSSMSLPKNLEMDAGLRWVGSLRTDNGGAVGTVPGYYELDARLGWRPTKSLEFSIVGQNLLHPHHPEYGPPSPTREEITRGFYGKIAWRY